MAKSQTHYADESGQTEDYILYDSIYVIFWRGNVIEIE